MPKECVDPAADDSSEHADEKVGNYATGRFARHDPTRQEANHESKDDPS